MKKRMSNFKFRAIFIPIAVLILALIIVSVSLLEVYSQALDWFFARGDASVSGGNGVNAEYYEQTYEKTPEGRKAAQKNGEKVTEAVADEGFVLLKNDGTLPLKKNAKVTPMGFRYQSPIYGGVGSGRVDESSITHTIYDTMKDYFDVNKTVENIVKSAKPRYMTDKGYSSSDGVSGSYSGGTTAIGELEPDKVYKVSDIGDYKTAFVFVGRDGGEGADLSVKPYIDGTPHQLALSGDEKKTIEFAKANCDKVIIIVNGANALELDELEKDPKINGILWIGNPGSVGAKSMGKILTGEVNPSGKTVDTYAKNALSHPASANFGDMGYSGLPSVKYVEYEEGIYVGYRYFETASDVGFIDYDEHVTYPFGYGLNYDDEKVTQTLTDVSYSNGKITVKGSICNSSDKYDVKEVIQIYFNPPYYADGSKIERATKNLIAFEKYEVKKGETKNFEIVIDEQDMACYDYDGYYAAGGAYVLEKGEYEIILGKDSHNEWGSRSFTLGATKAYTDGAVKNGAAASGKRSGAEDNEKNRFDEVTEYMKKTDCVMLSRSDFSKAVSSPTFKKGSAETTKEMPADAKKVYDDCKNGTLDYTSELEALFGTVAPVNDAKNGKVMSEYRGLDFDDPAWNDLLDQIDYTAKDLRLLIGKAAYGTGAVESIGKPATTDVDGPQGLSKVSPVNAYTGEAVLGATWNKALAAKVGEAIGEEMLAHTKVGWYAPAMNIHRTPFSGRNYEYYSEDPLHSGLLATAEVTAAANKGVVVYIKHFAVNDQETNRKNIATWATEQAIREIYLKPFEMCVKNAEIEIKYNKKDENGKYKMQTKKIKATLGVMSSMNALGARFACMNFNLQRGVLNGEWGFDGVLLTDSLDKSYDIDSALKGGTNLWLWYEYNAIKDNSSPLMQNVLRDSVHRVAYAYSNSLIMQGVSPGGTVEYAMSPWRVWEIILESTLAAAFIAIVFFIVYRTLDEKKNPDKYAKKGATK